MGLLLVTALGIATPMPTRTTGLSSSICLVHFRERCSGNRVHWVGKEHGGIGWPNAGLQQLAAAAELAADHPLLLSSGPDSPALERWIQRQLGQEGERLHQLREKLWDGVPWKRNDRVLLVESVPALALGSTGGGHRREGGVTLLAPSENDRQRLEAQITLLEPESRPSYCGGHGNPRQRGQGTPSGSADGAASAQLSIQAPWGSNFWTQLGQRCCPGAGLRSAISKGCRSGCRFAADTQHVEHTAGTADQREEDYGADTTSDGAASARLDRERDRLERDGRTGPGVGDLTERWLVAGPLTAKR